MESQVETSQSLEPAQQNLNLLEDSPQSPEVPEASPSQDLAQQEDSVQPDSQEPLQSSDSVAAEASKEEPEQVEEKVVAKAEEPESTVEDSKEESKEEVASEPEAVSYAALTDVELDSLTPEVRAHVEPILELASTYAVNSQRAVEAYDAAKSRLVDLADKLESSGATDAKPLIEGYEAATQTIERLVGEVTETAFSAFSYRHPEVKDLPTNIQEAVAAEFQQIGTKFQGDSLIEQMEDAYKFALYRTGFKPTPEKSATASTTTPNKPSIVPASRPQSAVAKKQSAVADGAVASMQPRHSVDEMSVDELLTQHLHLIA